MEHFYMNDITCIPVMFVFPAFSSTELNIAHSLHYNKTRLQCQLLVNMELKWGTSSHQEGYRCSGHSHSFFFSKQNVKRKKYADWGMSYATTYLRKLYLLFTVCNRSHLATLVGDVTSDVALCFFKGFPINLTRLPIFICSRTQYRTCSLCCHK